MSCVELMYGIGMIVLVTNNFVANALTMMDHAENVKKCDKCDVYKYGPLVTTSEGDICYECDRRRRVIIGCPAHMS